MYVSYSFDQILFGDLHCLALSFYFHYRMVEYQTAFHTSPSRGSTDPRPCHTSALSTPQVGCTLDYRPMNSHPSNYLLQSISIQSHTHMLPIKTIVQRYQIFTLHVSFSRLPWTNQNQQCTNAPCHRATHSRASCPDRLCPNHAEMSRQTIIRLHRNEHVPVLYVKKENMEGIY